MLRKSIEAIEANKKYIINVLCEPQMGRRGLYSKLSKRNGDGDEDGDKEEKLMMNFISLCDGQNSLLEIAETLEVPIWRLNDIAIKLKSHNLLISKD